MGLEQGSEWRMEIYSVRYRTLAAALGGPKGTGGHSTTGAEAALLGHHSLFGLIGNEDLAAMLAMEQLHHLRHT